MSSIFLKTFLVIVSCCYVTPLSHAEQETVCE